MCRKIIFYKSKTGNCPVEEFLDSLSGKQAQKVVWVLRLIEEFEVVPSQYFKKMVNTKDLWEFVSARLQIFFVFLALWMATSWWFFVMPFRRKLKRLLYLPSDWLRIEN
jgi:hypothetical protein